MIRLIVSDLDGTLLSEHDNIHPENLRAIEEAMARGVHFAIASGRSAGECSALALRHGLMDVHILGVNGCHVLDKPFGETLAAHYLPKEAAHEVMAISDKYGLFGCLFTDDAIVYSSEEAALALDAGVYEKMAQEAQGELQSGMRHGVGAAAMQAALDTTPMKAFCVYRERRDEAFEKARAECAKIANIEITSSWINNFEVMPVGVNKGTAVKALAARLGIDREDICAFGDSENDVEMLSWVGHGFAMGNAEPAAVKAANRQTAHCKDAGVAQAVRMLLAQG